MRKTIMLAIAATVLLGCCWNQNQNQDMNTLARTYEWDKYIAVREMDNQRKCR